MEGGCSSQMSNKAKGGEQSSEEEGLSEGGRGRKEYGCEAEQEEEDNKQEQEEVYEKAKEEGGGCKVAHEQGQGGE